MSEIADLLAELIEADDRYHNTGDSKLSDAEYDVKRLRFKQIAPYHPYNAKIGAEVRGGKVPLPYPMGGLDQPETEDDLRQWIIKNGWQNENFILSAKLDGTSDLQIYGQLGAFKAAYSRGNGTEGADITRHIKRMRVPLTIAHPAAVRCEVVLQDRHFPSLNANGEYKNARNYTAGKMNASDSNDDFCWKVDVIATSVVEPKMGKSEQISWLIDNGFDVPDHIQVSGQQLMEPGFATKWLEDCRARSPWAIDGIVVDLDNNEIRNSLERESSSLNPMYAVKFKVGAADNVAQTRVVKVHWEPSKTGYLKPRIEVEPVDLVGVTITFATGFNAKFIIDNGIGPGALVEITRSGDVIPFIQEVIEPATADLPTEYGIIGQDVYMTETGVDLYLADASENLDVHINRLVAFFADIGVDGLKEGNIEKTLDCWNLYRGIAKVKVTAADIIKMSEQDLLNDLGANGAKIYASIRKQLNPIELGVLAGASGLFGRGIGRRKMAKVVENHDLKTSEDMNGLSVRRIALQEGFDFKTAEKIVAGIPAFLEFLSQIDGYYTIASAAQPSSSELDGVVAVFTGVRSKELEAVIQSKGGKIGSTVSSKTTHVICADPRSGSTKLKKAEQVGVKPENIISLATAEEMWK